MAGLNGTPILYDYEALYNAEFQPSTVHAHNTGLSIFFQRYLMQKIFSVYDFEIPEEWDRDYFLYTIFTFGYGCVLSTDKYGIIFQHCQPYGRNIYYRPDHVLVSNPLLRKTHDLVIGVKTELIKLSPDWRGAYDVVSMYADMMALIMESFGVNAMNAKLSYVFAGENAAGAATFKKMFDQIASGEPAVFIDKKMFNEDGKPNWMLFDQDLKANFVGLDLLEALAKIENQFNTLIGIPNSNYEKKERLIVDEVNANNADTSAISQVWLRSLQDSIKKVNDMFSLDIKVRLKQAEITSQEVTENGDKTDSYDQRNV